MWEFNISQIILPQKYKHINLISQKLKKSTSRIYTVLGPLFFNTYVNDITKLIPKRYITIYAVDITLLKHNINQTKLEIDMFKYLNSIVQYVNEKGSYTNP